jgi:hypothetical protein
MLCHMLVWAKVRKVILNEIVNAQIFSNILVCKTLLAKKKNKNKEYFKDRVHKLRENNKIV